MNIVIEGMNGSGKSTLIDKLIGEFNDLGLDVKVFDMTKPESQREIDELADEFMDNKRIHIYDRVYWFSDLIYPTIYDMPKNEYIEKHIYEFWELPQKVIYCTDEYIIDDGLSHKRTEEELNKILKKRTQLKEEYSNVMNNFNRLFSDKLLCYNKDVNIKEIMDFLRG